MPVPPEVRILKVILENNLGSHVKNAVPFLMSLLPDLTIVEITEAIYELKRLDKVNIIRSDLGIELVVWEDSYLFIKQFEEAEGLRNAIKWDNHGWTFKSSAAGYIAGIISALAALWLKMRLFP